MNLNNRSAGLPLTIFFALCLGLFLPFAAPATDQQMKQAVPRAACQLQDRPETVQGETTVAEHFAPGPAKAYNCNLELVGHFQSEGDNAEQIAFVSTDGDVQVCVSPTASRSHIPICSGIESS